VWDNQEGEKDSSEDEKEEKNSSEDENEEDKLAKKDREPDDEDTGGINRGSGTDEGTEKDIKTLPAEELQQKSRVESAPKRPKPLIGPKSRVKRTEEEESGGSSAGPFSDETLPVPVVQRRHLAARGELAPNRPRPLIGPRSRVKRPEEEEAGGPAKVPNVDDGTEKVEVAQPVGLAQLERVVRLEEEKTGGFSVSLCSDETLPAKELVQQQRSLEALVPRPRPKVGPKSRVRRTEAEQTGGSTDSAFVVKAPIGLERGHSETGADALAPRQRPRVGPKSRVKRMEDEDCTGASDIIAGMWLAEFFTC